MTVKTKQYWINLLIDRCIAKNHRLLSGGMGQALQLDVTDSIMAGGLLLRAMSLLDDALNDFISTNNLLPSKENKSLANRLKGLNSQGRLANFSDIDSSRDRRNSVGHDVEENYSWDELDQCFDAVYCELSHLNILSGFPEMKARLETKRVEPTKDGVVIEQNITLTVYEDTTVYHQRGWVKRVGGK